jgi:uncharacterized protein
VHDPTLRKPALVSADEGSANLRLRARRCACGYVCFPPQSYGCERCGRAGDVSEEVQLEPRGALTSMAIVHVHGKLPTPYAVGRVLLDDGVTIDVCLETSEQLAIGSRVCGRLVLTKDASGVEALDCRFLPEERVS